MIALYIHELSYEVGQSHRTQEVMETKLLCETFLRLKVSLISFGSRLVPIAPLTATKYTLEQPGIIQFRIGVPAVWSSRQSLYQRALWLFFGRGVRSVGSLRCTSIDTPYQRVRKLKVLIAVKGELDQYPEQGSIATDLANDQIEWLDRPNWINCVSTLLERELKTFIFLVVTKLWHPRLVYRFWIANL